MAAIINDRDITLQATTPRLEEVGSNKIILLSSATNFVKTAGGIQPSSITIKPVLTGILNNLSTLTWNVSPTVTYSEAPDKTITINSSNVTIGTPVTFTATLAFLGITYTTSIVINSLQETIVSTLSKSSVTIATASDGSSGDYTAATSTMTVLVGNTDDSNNWTYSWSVPATVTATGSSTRTITVSAVSVNTPVTLTCTATKTGYTTQTKDFVITKGVAGSNAQLLTLDPTDWAFIFENSTATVATSPASITFTANKQNITGTVTFTATAYNSSNTSLGSVTLTGTGDIRTLTAANFNSLGTTTVRYVKVVATLGTLSDTVTIWRGDNGSDALTFLLTNESHTVPADSSGNVTSYTGALTYAAIFRGITNETSLWTITKSDGTGLTTTLTGTGTSNITLTVNTLASGTDSAISTITATRTGYPTLTKDFSISKSKAGAKGDQGDKGDPGSPGSTGLQGIRSITAYRVRNQTDSPLTTAPSDTSGATAPTDYSLTASSVTVGQVLWYSFGRYNPNASAVEGIPANTTVWSVPIAASIFQDIRSDNYNGPNPPTSADFGTTGYYFRRSTGELFATSAYLRGQLVTGASGAQRIEINKTDANKISIYNSNNQQLGYFGGTGLSYSDPIVSVKPLLSGTVAIGMRAEIPNTIGSSNTAFAYRGTTTDATLGGDLCSWYTQGGQYTKFGVVGTVEYISGGTWQAIGVLGYDDQATYKAGGRFYNSNGATEVSICDSAGYALNIRSGTIRYGSVTIGTPDGTNTKYLRADGTWATVSTSSLPSGGTTGQFLRGDGTWSNTLQGNLLVTGEVTAYSGSDIALKQDIVRIPNALEKVLSLGGYNFTWTDKHLQSLGSLPENYIKRDDVGIIAQQVRNVLPQAVVTRDDGILAVNYTKLIPLIIEAIIELHKKVSK